MFTIFIYVLGVSQCIAQGCSPLRIPGASFNDYFLLLPRQVIFFWYVPFFHYPSISPFIYLSFSVPAHYFLMYFLSSFTARRRFLSIFFSQLVFHWTFKVYFVPLLFAAFVGFSIRTNLSSKKPFNLFTVVASFISVLMPFFIEQRKNCPIGWKVCISISGNKRKWQNIPGTGKSLRRELNLKTEHLSLSNIFRKGSVLNLLWRG